MGRRLIQGCRKEPWDGALRSKRGGVADCGAAAACGRQEVAHGKPYGSWVSESARPCGSGTRELGSAMSGDSGLGFGQTSHRRESGRRAGSVPAIKATRQSRSPRRGERRPPTMPLMPAIRPVTSKRRAAEAPIRRPPSRAETGVSAFMYILASAPVCHSGAALATATAFRICGPLAAATSAN